MSHRRLVVGPLLLLAACSVDSAPSELPVTLSRQALTAQLTAQPAQLDFRGWVDLESSPKALLIHNDSSEPFTLHELSLVSSVFALAQAPEPPITLNPGGEVTLQVKFKPTDDSTASATLTLRGNDPNAEPLSVPLTGQGLWPSLEFDPGSVGFPDQLAGTTSPIVQVWVHNKQSLGMKSLTPSVTGPFIVSPPTIDLAPDGQQVLQISFSPAKADSGPKTGSLSFSNGTSAPMQYLSLRGEAVQTSLELVDPELDFGDVKVGQQAGRTVTLTNNSPLPVTVKSVSVGPPFTAVLPAQRTVGAGDTLSFQILFTPQRDGTFDRTTTINSDTTAPPLPLKLKGRGTHSLALDTERLDFGDTLLGEQGLRSLRLRNNGDVAVEVQASVTGPFSLPDFSSTRLLGPGDFLDFHVGFAPSAIGDAPGKVVFSKPDGTPVSLELGLAGRGVGPNPDISPVGALAFGAVEVGSPCGTQADGYNPNAPRTVIISNQADATGPLKIKSLKVTAPFRLLSIDPPAAPDGSFIIAPGESRALRVCYEPTQAGHESTPEQGKLSITSASSSTSLDIPLTGYGDKPALELSPAALAFGTVDTRGSRDLKLLLKNRSGLYVQLSEVTIDSLLFTFSGLAWPLTLTPYQVVELTVKFAPTQPGHFTATLLVKSDNARTEKVSMSGIGGNSRAVFNVLPFPKVQLGQSSQPQTVTVSNTGDAPLLIDGAIVEGPFSSSLPALGAGITIGPSDPPYTFTVTFTPDAAGPVKGKLTLITNAVPASAPVELSGEGLGIVEVLPHALDFGSSNVGVPSAEKSLLVHNKTSAPVKITSVTSTAPDAFITPPLTEAKTVLPDGFYVIPLRFKPGRLGANAGSIQITVDNAPSAQLESAVSGTGTSPNLELSPADVIRFGGIKVGTPSVPEAGVLTVFNKGSISLDADPRYPSVLTVSKLEITGPNADCFQVDPSSVPRVVLPGGQLRLPVVFWPKSVGAKVAALKITTGPLEGGADSEVRQVQLEGTGLASLLELSASELDFHTQVAGRLSAPRTFRLTNRGMRTLRVASMGMVGENAPDFSMELQDTTTGDVLLAPFDLAAGQAAAASVRYTPRIGVDSSAKVRVLTGDGDDVSVELKGKGISNDLKVEPGDLEVDFGTVLAPASASATSKLLTFSNQSSQPITLVAPALEGANPDHFQLLDAWTGERVLAPNERTTLKVAYQSQEATSSEAVLVVRRKESTSAEGLRLRLTGQAVVNLLDVSPTNLDFGWVDFGGQSDPREVVLTNRSRSARAIRVTEQTNPVFKVDDSKLAVLLQPGESTTLRVTFQPDARGVSEGQVRLRLVGESTADILLGMKGQVRSLDGHGSGCSAGGGEAVALLGLLAWGWFGRRRVRTEDSNKNP